MTPGDASIRAKGATDRSSTGAGAAILPTPPIARPDGGRGRTDTPSGAAIAARVAVLALAGSLTMFFYAVVGSHLLGRPLGPTAVAVALGVGAALGVACGLILGARNDRARDGRLTGPQRERPLSRSSG